MRVDKFTKIVLIVIAVNLTFLTLKYLDIIPKSYANSPPNHLELNPTVNYGIVPLNEDGSINVKLSDEQLDRIIPKNADGSINVKMTSDTAMNVNIEWIRGYPAGFTKSGNWVGLDVVIGTCSGKCVNH